MNLSIKPLVVIDTNVFISGLLWNGNPEKIIRIWLHDELVFVISPYLAHEIITTYTRFENSPTNVEALISHLEIKTRKITPQKKVTICRDPKDNQILDLCLASGANYLITGDQDLLSLKQYGQTRIVTAKEYLSEFS